MSIFFMLLAAVLVRLLVILPPATLDGDLAVWGLVAKYIATGQEFPVFVWLAHYGGSFYSYAAALVFNVCGVSSFSFILIGAVFSFVWAWLTLIIARRILQPEAARIAFLLALFPPYPVLYFSLMAMYSEVLLFGSLVLLILLELDARGWKGALLFVILGLFCGAGIWISPWMVSMFFTVLVIFLINEKKIFLSSRMILFICGFLSGYFPAIVYNVENPGATMMRSAGYFLDLDRSLFAAEHPVKVVLSRLIHRIGVMPITALLMPVIMIRVAGLLNFAVFFGGIISGIKGFIVHRRQRKLEKFDWLIMYAFCFFFFYTIVVTQQTSRYIFPLYLIFPYVVGKWMARFSGRKIIVALIVLYNLTSIGNVYLNRNVHHYPELTSWLADHRLAYGFSDYWTAYPVIFESNEAVLISPTLFHPSFADRRPAYTEKVRASEDIFYAVDTHLYPGLDKEMELKFISLGVEYRRDNVEEFIVFSGFSKKIFPEELKVTPARKKSNPRFSLLPAM